MNQFTKRLKELLQESGKTQKEICDELGISKQKMSKWKTGYNEPCLNEVIMLAKYFDVTTDYLLGVDEYERGSMISHSFNNFSNNGNILFK